MKKGRVKEFFFFSVHCRCVGCLSQQIRFILSLIWRTTSGGNFSRQLPQNEMDIYLNNKTAGSKATPLKAICTSH